MRGTRDAFEVKLQVDATQAKFNIGDSFLKGAGLPLKLVSSFYAQGESVAVRDASIVFGTDEVAVTGEISCDDKLSSKLMVRAKGLNTSSLKLFFPILKMFDATDALGLKLSVKGDLVGGDGLDVFGTFTADRIDFAGTSLSDASGALTSVDDGIAFDTIKGRFAGGQLSGNGRMLMGDDDAYHFDLVVDRLEAKDLGVTSGAITGQSSLVVEADGAGTDSEKVSRTLKLGGSFLLKSGTLESYKAIGALFNEETSLAVKAQAGAGFDDGWMNKLYDVSDKIENLRAEFVYADEKLSVEKLTWHNPLYKAELELNIDDEGAINGGGDVVLPKAVARQLIVDESARKLLLDRKGSLSIPINIMGVASNVKLDLDLVGLDEMIADDVRTFEPSGKPAKIVREKEEPVVGEKVAPKTIITKEEPEDAASKKVVTKQPKKKSSVRRRKKRPSSRSRREDAVNADDILKVIIGR